MSWWIVEHEDGTRTVHRSEPGTEGIDVGVRSAELPRAPHADGYERWDFEVDQFVVDADLRQAVIDRQFATMHGQYQRAVNHAIKTVEARLILAGVAIDGLVAAEAAATDTTAEALAAVIVAKASAETIPPEIGRIVAKRAARAEEDS